MPIAPLLLAPTLLSATLPAPAQAAPAGCTARQLRLATDGRDGDFNGMSHSGTALVIRNEGAPCILPALPLVHLLDARGRPLPATRRAPPGMHPGPVMVPVRLAHGERATTDLRWVSGPVYQNSRALRAAFVTVRVGRGSLRAPLGALLYGDAGTATTFDQTPLVVGDADDAR